MKAPKLLDAYGKDILKMSAAGQSARDIAAWLLKEHKVEASHKTVLRFLQRTKEERTEVAKAVVREKLVPSVTADLDVLAGSQERLLAYTMKLNDEVMAPVAEGLNPEERARVLQVKAILGESYRKAEESLVKVTDVRLHYSGADQPDAPGANAPIPNAVLATMSDEELDDLANGQRYAAPAAGAGADRATPPAKARKRPR